jgi:hypothetical protein
VIDQVAEVVIVKNYCGILQECIINGIGSGEPLYDIILRDKNDPRIKIEMEGIRYDEIRR